MPGISVYLITIVFAKPSGFAKKGIRVAGSAGWLACSPSLLAAMLIFP